MRYKKIKAVGLVIGALALCGLGPQARSDTTPVVPVALTGTVDHYYVDRSGYVTAVDLKTTDGDKWVHFSPSMAKRVTDTYPVGSTASIFVTPAYGGWDLAGLDATPPTVVLTPYPYTGFDVLRGSPMTTIGAPLMTISGKLTGYIADQDRSILAIILDNDKLVRISPEFRQETPPNVPEGITPLFKGSDIVAVGYPEAPRYGSLSPYQVRLIPYAVEVNGRSLGNFGFGKLGERHKTLFDWDLGGGILGSEPKEMHPEHDDMGYMVYEAPK